MSEQLTYKVFKASIYRLYELEVEYMSPGVAIYDTGGKYGRGYILLNSESRNYYDGRIVLKFSKTIPVRFIGLTLSQYTTDYYGYDQYYIYLLDDYGEVVYELMLYNDEDATYGTLYVDCPLIFENPIASRRISFRCVTDDVYPSRLYVDRASIICGDEQLPDMKLTEIPGRNEAWYGCVEHARFNAALKPDANLYFFNSKYVYSNRKYSPWFWSDHVRLPFRELKGDTLPTLYYSESRGWARGIYRDPLYWGEARFGSAGRDGNIYFVGNTVYWCQGEPGSNCDDFIVSYTAGGEFRWMKSFGGAYDDGDYEYTMVFPHPDTSRNTVVALSGLHYVPVEGGKMGYGSLVSEWNSNGEIVKCKMDLNIEFFGGDVGNGVVLLTGQYYVEPMLTVIDNSLNRVATLYWTPYTGPVYTSGCIGDSGEYYLYTTRGNAFNVIRWSGGRYSDWGKQISVPWGSARRAFKMSVYDGYLYLAVNIRWGYWNIPVLFKIDCEDGRVVWGRELSGLQYPAGVDITPGGQVVTVAQATEVGYAASPCAVVLDLDGEPLYACEFRRLSGGWMSGVHCMDEWIYLAGVADGHYLFMARAPSKLCRFTSDIYPFFVYPIDFSAEPVSFSVSTLTFTFIPPETDYGYRDAYPAVTSFTPPYRKYVGE
ncbi:MAG: hypothetical protein QW734_04670 [Candidatus Bathyarchaeia archaeon]